jgi:hypothetical protein
LKHTVIARVQSSNTTKQLRNLEEDFFDGDPTRPGLTGVGSDVDTGNAEICLVTANSLEQFSN